VRNIIAAIKQKWTNRSVRSRQRLWDKEYAHGFGDLLKLPQERAHYATLIDFMVSAAKNKTILDVCCGEGALLDLLETCGYQKYLGVGAKQMQASEEQKKLIAPVIEDFARSFGKDASAILASEFTRIAPASARPFASKYTWE
jgi:2-polyprenyl-3-methyl-5-hydroxy-6-metoxy-1,4-benzoquinol methylase